MPPARQMTGCGQSDLRRRVAQPRSELRLRPPGEPSAPVPEGITRVACFPTGRGIPHRRGFGYWGCDAPEEIPVAWRVFTYKVCRSFRTPGSPLANSDAILSRALKRSSSADLPLECGV